MAAEHVVRRLLSPLRDAAIVDRALADVPDLARSPREAFARIVRAVDRAEAANVSVVELMRSPREAFALEASTTTRETARARATKAVESASDALMRTVRKDEGSASARDGRMDGKWHVGGTMKGTSTREEDLKVRFWNLWGGSRACRTVMTKSARDSVYRNPERLERAVLNLDRVAPFVDSPMLLHRAPELLEYPTEEIVRRLVRMKFLFASFYSVDVGFVATQTPSLLLLEPETLARAVGAFADGDVATLAARVAEFVARDGIDAFAALGTTTSRVEAVNEAVTSV